MSEYSLLLHGTTDKLLDILCHRPAKLSELQDAVINLVRRVDMLEKQRTVSDDGRRCHCE